MAFTNKALLAAFLVTAVAPLPALAQQQRGAPAAAQPQQAQLQPSKEARPALAALQKAVQENKTAEIPALAQAALAAAKTPVDRYLAWSLQLRPALDAKNDAVLRPVLEGMIESGVPQGRDLALQSTEVGKIHYRAKAWDPAAARFEQSIATGAASSDTYLLLADVRVRQKRQAEAVALLQQAIAKGNLPAEDQKKFGEQAFAIAFNANLPVARELAMAQLKAAPTSTNWRRAIKTAERGIATPDRVDLYRLQRATKSLEGEQDHFVYVDGLLARGLPGEAKAVLEEAFAAGRLDRSQEPWKGLIAAASTRSASDRPTLVAGERAALTAATARPALNTGDAFMGYGDYARAAALYRAALTKSGVDADLANLRLGIALARSGDRAGATTAFNAVKGARAPIAQMWLLWLSMPAA